MTTLPQAPVAALGVARPRKILESPSLRFAAKTLFRLVLTLFGVLTVLFFLLRVSGDPASSLAGPDATPIQVDAIRTQLGLDQSLLVQYWDFVRGAVVFDFGDSYQYKTPAIDLVLNRLPATLGLVLIAYAIALLVAIPLGMLTALTKSRLYARFVDTLVVVGQSAPVFAIAVVVVYYASVQQGLVPSLSDEGFGGPIDAMILPILVLAFAPVAQLLELTRSGLHESMREDFVRTAEAKGAPATRVVFRHALRPVGTTLLNVTGTDIAGLLSGGIVVEAIFAWPGLGSVLVSAVSTRDYPLVAASTFVIGVVVVLINVAVDVGSRYLDPRIRKGEAL